MILLINLLPAAAAMPSGEPLAGPLQALWLRAMADGISALSSLVILAAVIVFLRRRRDLGPVTRGLGALFVAFLAAGFMTHLMLAVTLWLPAYGIQGGVAITTAVVSLTAAVAIWPQLPKAIDLPTPGDLVRSNDALTRSNASLQSTIAARTHELEQGNQRFELALSRSNITVFTQDPDLRYTWIHNPRDGLTPASVDETGVDAAGFADTPELADMKRRVLATGETSSRGIGFAGGTEDELYFDVTISPTHGPDGAIDGVLGTAVDLTERRRFERRLNALAMQAAEAYRRIELALEDSPITVFEQNADLRYTFVQNPPPGTSVEDFLGHTDFEIFATSGGRSLVSAKSGVLVTGERRTVEAELNLAGTSRYYAVRLEPKTGPSGNVDGIIGTAVDLTERRRGEQHMRLVMRELTHRSKNMLAVVQAMARKTASITPDTDTFIRDFSSRLRAMAAAQDVLVAESWSGAELRDLLGASLSQTVDPAAPELRIEGPDLKLTPDAAQTLGLAFHELTMNAARHGALSVPGGDISVRWSHEDGEVRIRWEERGGPIVSPPERTGFGRILLERLVGASLAGRVTLDFRPEGIACELIFPDDRLISPRSAGAA